MASKNYMSAPCENCGRPQLVPVTGEKRIGLSNRIEYFVEPGLTCSCGEPLEIVTVFLRNIPQVEIKERVKHGD